MSFSKCKSNRLVKYLKATSKFSCNFVIKMSSERSGSKCQLCHKNVLFKMTIDLEASGRTLTATYMKRLRGGFSTISILGDTSFVNK